VGETAIKKVKLETDIDGHADGSPDDGVKPFIAFNMMWSWCRTQDKSSAESSVNDDFDFEDESDHQDYDANYFDNGEGDDDSGGEDGTHALVWRGWMIADDPAEEGGGGGFDDWW